MKIKLILLCLFASLFLTSCFYDYESEDVMRINKESITDIDGMDEEMNQNTQLIGVNREHKVTVNNEEITLQTSYRIPESRLNNYLYTIPTGIELTSKVLNLPNKRYNVKISNLYADVTILSNRPKYNGLRQDSMNLSFLSIPSAGYDIDLENAYTQLFHVEGVNQSEMFIRSWYGYDSSKISTSYNYLSENDIRSKSEGAILQTVWSISILDTSTGKIYSSYVADKILMRSKEPVYKLSTTESESEK
jgi:lipoprotein